MSLSTPHQRLRALFEYSDELRRHRAMCALAGEEPSLNRIHFEHQTLYRLVAPGIAFRGSLAWFQAPYGDWEVTDGRIEFSQWQQTQDADQLDHWITVGALNAHFLCCDGRTRRWNLSELRNGLLFGELLPAE